MGTEQNNEGDFALDMGNYGIPAEELRCPGCVPPYTMVSGYPYQNIAACQIDEVIYGHAARDEANIVEDIFTHDYDGELIVLKAQGCLPIELTPEHEILVLEGIKRNSSTPGTHRIKFKKPPESIKASDVLRRPNPYAKEDIGHYLLIPAAKGYYSNQKMSLLPFLSKNGRRVLVSKGFPYSFPLNQDTAWLLGLYVADGCTGKDITFYLGSSELDVQNKLISIIRSIGFTPRTESIPDEKAVTIYLSSRVLSRFFRYWCGHNAKEKQIPKFIIDHCDNRILLSFLEGYLAGDGYVRNTEKKCWAISSGTVSKGLALQLQLLGARLGQLFSIHERMTMPSKIRGRVIKGGRKYYTIDIFPGNITTELGFHKSQGRVKYRQLSHYIATPIAKIEKRHYTGPVMNLQTRNNTFLVNNLIVHNCHRFLGYTAIAWGAIRIKCPNCKRWTLLDISPKKS
jgi:hypothetical protein